MAETCAGQLLFRTTYFLVVLISSTSVIVVLGIFLWNYNYVIKKFFLCILSVDCFLKKSSHIQISQNTFFPDTMRKSEKLFLLFSKAGALKASVSLSSRKMTSSMLRPFFGFQRAQSNSLISFSQLFPALKNGVGAFER